MRRTGRVKVQDKQGPATGQQNKVQDQQAMRRTGKVKVQDEQGPASGQAKQGSGSADNIRRIKGTGQAGSSYQKG
jgi:hypothetical protein